jgi:hypothetical protein
LVVSGQWLQMQASLRSVQWSFSSWSELFSQEKEAASSTVAQPIFSDD